MNNSGLEEFENSLDQSKTVQYDFKLYITGLTPNSVRAVENIKNLLEEYLKGKYNLEIIDIYQQPERTETDQIIAAPTLVKCNPTPVRKLIGDMSKKERVLQVLGLKL